MRALILVAGAALAVSACSSNEAADNTMNVDENLAVENLDTTNLDMNATDNLTLNADNVTIDANTVTTNGTDTATDANATGNNAM
jgi:hypothetical protein